MRVLKQEAPQQTHPHSFHAGKHLTCITLNLTLILTTMVTVKSKTPAKVDGFVVLTLEAPRTFAQKLAGFTSEAKFTVKKDSEADKMAIGTQIDGLKIILLESNTPHFEGQEPHADGMYRVKRVVDEA